jgi:plastocyanin
MKRLTTAAAIACLLVSHGALAAEHVVGQKNKQFTAEQLDIKVGDSVKFTNEDPFFHNVYSLSEIKTFDLGSYEKGKSKSVTFDKPGKIDVECAIHPNMHMVINVSE